MSVDTIRLIGYNPCSVADGVGLREVLYIAQCTHRCKGCQNAKYWDDLGDEYTINEVVNKLIKNPLTNITLSGGDGLTVQYENTLELCKRLKEKSNKNIWVYTGYTYDELIKLNKTEIFKYIDVLVDGRYIEEQRNITLKFRGSENQEIIDIQKTLTKGEKILWEG